MHNKNILLGVNIDHSATLRQARYKESKQSFGQMVEPDPLQVALAAERAGADSITIHLREDRRHIQEIDVERICSTIQTRLNLEMAPTDFMIEYALKVKPYCVCLVPESREEISTEGGLNLLAQPMRLQYIIQTLHRSNIGVSLFIEPDIEQIEKAAEIGAFMIELHTGAFANNFYHKKDAAYELSRLCIGAETAHKLDLTINAGHGINYVNIGKVCEIPWLHELNIGHSIISRSLLTGIEEAVAVMKILMERNSDY